MNRPVLGILRIFVMAVVFGVFAPFVFIVALIVSIFLTSISWLRLKVGMEPQ